MSAGRTVTGQNPIAAQQNFVLRFAPPWIGVDLRVANMTCLQHRAVRIA